MNFNQYLALAVVVWIIICMIIAWIGGKHKERPNPKFDKIPIILGIAVPLLLVIAGIIGAQ